VFEQFYTAKPLQASHMNHKQKFYITKSLNWAAVTITNGAKIYIHFVVYGSQII